MTIDEYKKISKNHLHNITYEQFLDFNKYKKIHQAEKITITDVDFKNNVVQYTHYGADIYVNIIDDFIYIHMAKYNIYISNPSLLKNWNGFKKDFVFLNRYVIQYVNVLIPASLSDKYNQLHKYWNKKDCTLNFEVVEKDKLPSFILRNKIAYECEQIEEHFWYVKKNYNITIIADLPIYTPINSYFLFENVQFCHIDLSNVNFKYTKSFASAFINSFCSSIDFGSNLNTSNVTNLSSMFENSKVEEIDLRNWDLSHVNTMERFCYNSTVDSVYLNPNTKSLESLVYAFYNTNISFSNINEIYTKK